LTNIKDGEFYDGGCTYVSCPAETHAKEGLMTAYADASHMEGKGSSTFGTYFNVGTYTSNRSLCSIVSGHGIGPECKGEWDLRLEAAAAIVGFDVPGRTTVVDLEEAIDTAHDAAMHNGTKFNDESLIFMFLELAPPGSNKSGMCNLFQRTARHVVSALRLMHSNVEKSESIGFRVCEESIPAQDCTGTSAAGIRKQTKHRGILVFGPYWAYMP